MHTYVKYIEPGEPLYDLIKRGDGFKRTGSFVQGSNAYKELLNIYPGDWRVWYYNAQDSSADFISYGGEDVIHLLENSEKAADDYDIKEKIRNTKEYMEIRQKIAQLTPSAGRIITEEVSGMHHKRFLTVAVCSVVLILLLVAVGFVPAGPLALPLSLWFWVCAIYSFGVLIKYITGGYKPKIVGKKLSTAKRNKLVSQNADAIAELEKQLEAKEPIMTLRCR